jgi:hypothetical protein
MILRIHSCPLVSSFWYLQLLKLLSCHETSKGYAALVAIINLKIPGESLMAFVRGHEGPAVGSISPAGCGLIARPALAPSARKRTSTALHALAAETPTAMAKARDHTGRGDVRP